jgi:hypothetical protein
MIIILISSACDATEAILCRSTSACFQSNDLDYYGVLLVVGVLLLEMADDSMHYS